MALGIMMKQSPKEEICSPVFWRDVWAEVMCSIMLLFVAFSVGFKLSEDEPPVSVVAIAFANAFVVFAMIEMMSHVSGAIFNPVVTTLFLITQRISPVKAFVYIIAQCIGAIIGASIAYSVANPIAREHMQPISLNNISVGAGVGCEAFITHTLCLTIQGATDLEHRVAYMPGLAISAAVAAGIFSAVRLTGAAMNPLSSLGPAVVTGIYTNHWIYWIGQYLTARGLMIYWVGPLIGMFIAALEYNIIYCSFWPKEEKNIDEKDIKEEIKVVKDMNGRSHDNSAFQHEDHNEIPPTRF